MGSRHFLAIVHGAAAALFPSTSGVGLEPDRSHRPGVGVLLAGARITASGEPGPADQTAFHPINNEKTEERRFSCIKINVAAPPAFVYMLSSRFRSISFSFFLFFFGIVA